MNVMARPSYRECTLEDLLQESEGSSSPASLAECFSSPEEAWQWLLIAVVAKTHGETLSGPVDPEAMMAYVEDAGWTRWEWQTAISVALLGESPDDPVILRVYESAMAKLGRKLAEVPPGLAS